MRRGGRRLVKRRGSPPCQGDSNDEQPREASMNSLIVEGQLTMMVLFHSCVDSCLYVVALERAVVTAWELPC